MIPHVIILEPGLVIYKIYMGYWFFGRPTMEDRGVDVSEPFHFGSEGQTPGLDPGRADYNSFVSFNDPDGNGG